MNFLDIVIIGGILLGGLIGYRKGLINSVIDVASSFLAFMAAFATYRDFTPLLNDWGLGTLVRGFIKDGFTRQASASIPLKGTGLDQLSLVTGAMPENLQKPFNDMFIGLMKSAVGTTIKTVGDAIAQYFTLVILSMISFLVIFAIAKLVVVLLSTLLTKNLDRSMAGSLNHSGGFLAGALSALLFIAIVMGFIVPAANFFSQSTLLGLINQSLLTKLMTTVFAGLAGMF